MATIGEKTELGKKYLEAESKVDSIRTTLKMIDQVHYEPKLSLTFSGKFMRSSKTFYLTEEELKGILNTRLISAIVERNKFEDEYNRLQ